MKNIQKVGTPLTIVAIFAGLAEVAGATVLPLIDSRLQSIFIWYVMLFPLILLVSFFITWNFNTKVLYPPSEFKDEKNYLNLLRIEDQEEIIKAQSENLEDLKKQLLEVKDFINNTGSTNYNNIVNYGIDVKKTEEIGDNNNKENEKSKKTKNEMYEVSKKLNDALQNVEVAQTYQKVFSKVVARRNPTISKFAIMQANGKCELCKTESNIVKKDGFPHLEVHHVIPLSEGGQDVYENIVALCPNCHSRVHHSNDAKDLQKKLEDILKERKNSA